MSEEYCTTHQDDKMCFVPICRYHVLLKGDIKQLLQKLDAFCFYYQYVDCLNTPFKCRFCSEIVVKNGQLFDNVQKVAQFHHQNKGSDRMPRIGQRRLLRKNNKKKLVGPFQKSKSTQTSGSVFANRIEQVQKAIPQLELMKFVD